MEVDVVYDYLAKRVLGTSSASMILILYKIRQCFTILSYFQIL